MRKLFYISILIILYLFVIKAENENKFSRPLNITKTTLATAKEVNKDDILSVNINFDINANIVELVKLAVDLGVETIKNIINVINDTLNDTLGSRKRKIKDSRPTEYSRFISIMTGDELMAFHFHENKRHIVFAEGALSNHSCGKAGEWTHIKVTRETGKVMCSLYRVKNLIKHGEAVCNISYFSNDPNVFKCTCKERTIRGLNTVDNDTKSCILDIDLDNDAFAFMI